MLFNNRSTIQWIDNSAPFNHEMEINHTGFDNSHYTDQQIDLFLFLTIIRNLWEFRNLECAHHRKQKVPSHLHLSHTCPGTPHCTSCGARCQGVRVLRGGRSLTSRFYL